MNVIGNRPKEGKRTVVFLHGFGETAEMWLPLMKRLSMEYNVCAVDLPGSGSSEDLPLKENQYTKVHLAELLHQELTGMGITRCSLVGHDIGMMVAYAYANLYPAELEQLVLMDAFLPGIEGWEEVYNDPKAWHFRFTDETAARLVEGKERTYLDHFWNDLAANPTYSVSPAHRIKYTDAYRPHIRAQMEYFSSFLQDAEDFSQFSPLPSTVPILVLTGEMASNHHLSDQVLTISSNVQAYILANTGHWLLDEQPLLTMDLISSFLHVPTHLD